MTDDELDELRELADLDELERAQVERWRRLLTSQERAGTRGSLSVSFGACEACNALRSILERLGGFPEATHSSGHLRCLRGYEWSNR
jgi:hypothetical protein